MERKGFITQAGTLIFGVFLFSVSFGQETSATVEATANDAPTKNEKAINNDALAELGRAYFEGSKRFSKGGPACITCHNVNHKSSIPGGVLAKDLTDVYERMGEGITGWLSAPPFPAMATAYTNHELTEKERKSLTAFFKESSENKGEPESAITYFLIGGAVGLLTILILINILWYKRKKQMVKREIFARQAKAWDAKH